jgi:hypothetical protein
MPELKPKQVRMNLNEECQAMFAELSRVAQDLPESQLSTLIITAGLRALKAEGYQITIPLRFRVVAPNESKQ